MVSQKKKQQGSILVVEDDVDLCQILDEKLSELGFKVLTADSVSGATFKISNQKFEFIMLDIKIKQGDSLSILEHLKKDPLGQNYKTPVFILSGNLDLPVLQKLKGQVSAIIAKPFTVDILVQRMSQFGFKAPENTEQAS